MKSVCKMLVMVLLCVTILPSSMTFANTQVHNDIHTNDVIVMSQSCPACTYGYLIVQTQYSPWSYTGAYQKCQHKSNGHDYQQSRSVMTTYSCNSCSFSTTTATRTEYQWVCNGF